MSGFSDREKDFENKNAYALDVVGTNLEIPGFDDVLKKVRDDLAKKRVDISDHLLRTMLDKAQAQAREQILKEGT